MALFENPNITQSFHAMVNEDIEKCIKYLSDPSDEKTGIELHCELTSKYTEYIRNLGKGLYGYNEQADFYLVHDIGHESVVFNLKSIRYKLEAYKNYGYKNCSDIDTGKGIEISNTLTANQNTTISFETVIKQINDMTALSDAETKEILQKIDELKNIIDSSDNKKSKWAKIKPFLTWLTDKSVDVGIALLQLVLKIQ